jgi:hypothetical protein
MTGSHNANQKERGGGEKAIVRRNVADNTKLKDNLMELCTEWDRKFPLNDNT